MKTANAATSYTFLPPSLEYLQNFSLGFLKSVPPFFTRKAKFHSNPNLIIKTYSAKEMNNQDPIFGLSIILVSFNVLCCKEVSTKLTGGTDLQ